MKAASAATPDLDLRTSAYERDPRWKLVQRIVADPSFVRSTRLSQFLIYVCREFLAGRAASLNEQRIGEVVFERPVGYDPREDNIVRSHASRLRLRLEAYFKEEGAAEELRLVIPRGSYVPVFERVHFAEASAAEGLAAATVEDVSAAGMPVLPFPQPVSHTEASIGSSNGLAATTADTQRPRLRQAWVFVLTVLLAVAGAAFWWTHRNSPTALGHRTTPSQMLWTQMFHADQDTLIVPADSNLVLAQQMLGHPVTLAEYATGRYRSAVDCSLPCDRDLLREIQNLRYTSVADLEFAVTLSRLPEALPNRTRIRYARDLQMEDLKQSNLILAGSLEADPWLSLIDQQMNFILHDGVDGGRLRVENKRPQEHEKSEYPYFDRDPEHRGLATIAFLKNLSGNGNILVVQGFTHAGTQAAAEFVTSGTEFDTLLRSHVGADSHLPHFEILLQTMDVNGMSSHPIVLALHIS